ncbi:MAG: hypothetical protein ACOCQX_01120 [Candidatus Nanoarchaeia archaeon]
MKKRFMVLAIIVFGMILFVAIGFPFLRSMKTEFEDTENKTESSINTSVNESDVERINLTAEPACTDPMSGESNEKCETEEGCENACSGVSGCTQFGLEYEDASLEDDCICICRRE